MTKKNMALATIAQDAEQILLPSRYQEPFTAAFRALTGIQLPSKPGRQMCVRANGKVFRWLRGRDIPQMVALASRLAPSITTIGLTGSEWCSEYDSEPESNAIQWQNIGEKLGEIAIIAPKNSDIQAIKKQIEANRPLDVVTAYPNLVKAQEGQFSPRITLQGCVESISELAALPAIDLVSTGETVAANDFVVIKRLETSYPALVMGYEASKGELI
jgi:ATP phosphoribosyltransferase